MFFEVNLSSIWMGYNVSIMSSIEITQNKFSRCGCLVLRLNGFSFSILQIFVRFFLQVVLAYLSLSSNYGRFFPNRNLSKKLRSENWEKTCYIFASYGHSKHVQYGKIFIVSLFSFFWVFFFCPHQRIFTRYFSCLMLHNFA